LRWGKTGVTCFLAILFYALVTTKSIHHSLAGTDLVTCHCFVTVPIFICKDKSPIIRAPIAAGLAGLLANIIGSLSGLAHCVKDCLVLLHSIPEPNTIDRGAVERFDEFGAIYIFTRGVNTRELGRKLSRSNAK
jgi:hypothetical protein